MIQQQTKELYQALLSISEFEIVKELAEFMEGEVSLLFLLAQMQTTAQPSDIARALSISKGRVTSLLNALQEKKLIRISPDEQDRRKLNVRLSKEGAIYIQKKINHSQQYLYRFITRFGEEKTASLLQLLKEMTNVLKEGIQ